MGIVSVDLPQEVITLLGGSPARVAHAAREALVLGLLRCGKISQGQAGAFLGLDRSDVLDRMAAHNIESGPVTIAELQREVDRLDRFMRDRGH